MRRLYTLLLYLALPFAALIIWARTGRNRGALVGWRERFGFGTRRDGGGIWVHAVSVGEVQAAAILIAALRERHDMHGALELSLTCATPTGRARARTLMPDVDVRYAPYDLPGSLRRCLARLRPRLLIVIETELWPNLLHEARRAGIPTLIATARISERSARIYRRLPGLLRATLAANVWVGAQSAADARRFIDLGVPSTRASVVGNIKFDRTVPANVRRRGAALRARYGQSRDGNARPLWIAGSTHPGEEQVVLAAHRRLLQTLPQALLVLAPRHPPRFEQAAAVVAAQGLRYSRRSRERTASDAPYEVLLLDTLGELMEFYAAADVAFVGGSLVGVGGHNLLEPAALGLPVLTGPHQFNSPDIARILAGHAALTTVADAAGLAATLQVLLTNTPARTRMGAAGQAAIEANQGALERLLSLVGTLYRSEADQA